MIANNTAFASREGLYCSEKNKYCINANFNGYCSFTGCTQSGYDTAPITYTCELTDELREEFERVIGHSQVKMIDYTDKWKGFQFRSPNYLDGHFSKYEFDLVKWNNNACYSVGKLIWDADERSFEFESVGLRFLQDYVYGLNEWIIAFAKMKEIELRVEEC